MLTHEKFEKLAKGIAQIGSDPIKRDEIETAVGLTIPTILELLSVYKLPAALGMLSAGRRGLDPAARRDVIEFAEQALGSPERARAWLERPNAAFFKLPPIDLLQTEEGADEVRRLLGRIAHGIAA